jgi:hypothetical protein
VEINGELIIQEGMPDICSKVILGFGKLQNPFAMAVIG